MMIQTVCIIVWAILVTFFWGIVIILASVIIHNENFIHNIAKIWANLYYLLAESG